MLSTLIPHIVSKITVAQWSGFETCECGRRYSEAENETLRQIFMESFSRPIDHQNAIASTMGSRQPCIECMKKLVAKNNPAKREIWINGITACPSCGADYTLADKIAWGELLASACFCPVKLNTPPLCTCCEDKRLAKILR